MSYYNPDIPLESALEFIEDSHWRYEIIEDYYAAFRLLGNTALEADSEDHIIRGYN